jgi:heme O synthase-like polyprenyltransferase
MSGTAYLATALALGVAFSWLALQFAKARTDETARRLFFGSIMYLPLLWIAMIADRL